jgi:hypothetical protein
MTCEWVRLPGLPGAMVCGPRPRRRTCQQPGCRAPALFQCDWPTPSGGTCDRYLCAAHRVSPPGEGVDFCPEHVRQLALPLDERG